MKETKKKTGTWSKRFLMLAAAFVMIFVMKNTANAAGVQTVDMQQKNGVYVYTGIWEDYDTTVYHRITVPKSGVLFIGGTGITSYGSRYGIYVTLYDSMSRELGPYGKESVTADDLAEFRVKPGTYYIKVEGEKYYALSAGVYPCADRGGVSKKKATRIKQNKAITGILPTNEKGSKADWFKFTVSKSKKLQLELAAYGDTGVIFYLYGPSYKKGQSLSQNNSADKYYSINSLTRKKMKIKKGTYYIKVVRSYKGNGYSANYQIKWKLK